MFGWNLSSYNSEGQSLPGRESTYVTNLPSITANITYTLALSWSTIYESTIPPPPKLFSFAYSSST